MMTITKVVNRMSLRLDMFLSVVFEVCNLKININKISKEKYEK